MLSAGTDGNYDAGQETCVPKLETQQGTSMACPAAAGAAVMVRQYFMDGFYPTGKGYFSQRQIGCGYNHPIL